MEYKRISPTTVEIDGETYTKNYQTSYQYEDDVFNRIKSIEDVLSCDALKIVSIRCNPGVRESQVIAFSKLSIFADVINENKTHDENGFRYYVYYNIDHKEFYICEHTYSVRHTIYFASRKLAQYSIEKCRNLWLDFYGIN